MGSGHRGAYRGCLDRKDVSELFRRLWHILCILQIAYFYLFADVFCVEKPQM